MMIQSFELKDMSKQKACWALLPICGGSQDGESNGDGGEGDPPADPPADTKIEVDEKEYKGLKEFREKAGEDFDPEKWKSLKGYDPLKVAENMEFGTAVEKDAMVQAILKERIAAKKEGRKVSLSKIMAEFKDELDGSPADPKGQQPGAKAPVDPKVEAHEAWIRGQQEKEIQQAFDTDFEKELTGQKLKLSGKEKVYLKELVENTFIRDLKLKMEDLPRIMKECTKTVLEYRKELQEEWNREISGAGAEEEQAPPPLTGEPAQPAKRGYDPRKATSAERVGAIANELKEKGYGR